jgi:hypothetical protein
MIKHGKKTSHQLEGSILWSSPCLAISALNFALKNLDRALTGK